MTNVYTIENNGKDILYIQVNESINCIGPTGSILIEEKNGKYEVLKIIGAAKKVEHLFFGIAYILIGILWLGLYFGFLK